ncbi:MAG: hypothetical protein ACXIUD_05195 [Mongoliitalea sp.]
MKRLLVQIVCCFVFVGALTSCRIGFDDDDDRPNDPRETLIESLHNTFFQFNVLGGTESEDLRVENDGMHGIYGLSSTDIERLSGNLGILRCFQATSLTMQQMARVRSSTMEFMQCRNGNSREYQMAVRNVLSQLSQQRERLVAAFEKGDLTSEEARARFQTLREIAHQQIMDEKLKFSQDLRGCLETYIENLSGIMSEDQWKVFTSCILD